MKSFTLKPKEAQDFHVIVYIFKNAKKINRVTANYWDKKANGTNVQRSIKSSFSTVTLENLSAFEREQGVSLPVYSSKKLVRQSSISSPHKCPVLLNENGSIAIILDFSLNRRSGQQMILFEAIGHCIGKSGAQVALEYRSAFGARTEIDITDDSDFKNIFNCGFNCDINISNRYARKFRSSASKFFSFEITSDINLLPINELIFVTNTRSGQYCTKSRNCLYCSAMCNIKRHEATCTAETLVTYDHLVTKRTKSIREILVQQKFFNTKEDALLTDFVFVNFTTAFKNNEEFVICASAFGKINKKVLSETFTGTTWMTNLVSFLKLCLDEHRSFIFSDPNHKRIRMSRLVENRDLSTFVELQRMGEYAQIEKYFKLRQKLKIFTNSLDHLYCNLGEITPIFGDFELSNKGRNIISIYNEKVQFSDLTAYLAETQNVSQLAKSWLKRPVTALPSTMIIDDIDSVENFPEVIDNDDNNLRSENILLCDENIKDFIINRTKVIAKTMNEIVLVMSKYYFTIFDCDICAHKTLSSLSFTALTQSYNDNALPLHTLSEKHKKYAEDVRTYCWGGLCWVLKKHMCTFNDYSYPLEALFTKDNAKINRIMSLDVNSQYPHQFFDDMPTGIPIIWEPNNNGKFVPSFGVKSDNFSLASIEWLEYEQNELRKKYPNANIITGMNKGEVRIHELGKEDGGKVDGYAEVSGNKFIYEFYGCYWHLHEKCYPNLQDDEWEEQILKYERDRVKREKLSKYGEVITIWECEWNRKKRNINFTSNYVCPIYLEKEISKEIILSENFFGFVKCTLRIGGDFKEKLGWTNFPLLFEKRNIDNHEILVPSEESTMLIYTPLLQYYLKMGVMVDNISYCISYQKSKPFETFGNLLQGLRQKAFICDDTVLSTAIKQISNSSIGKLGFNVLKHTHMKVKKDINIDLRKGRLTNLKSLSNGSVEITKKPRAKIIKANTHCYLAILQLSKLKFLKFIFELGSLVRPGSFCIAYVDTDSIVLGFNDTGRGLESLVAPERHQEWKTFESKYFVLHPGQAKEFGRLKQEVSFNDGHFLCTGPKSYILHSESVEGKKALAGSRANLNFDSFYASIYKSEPTVVNAVKKFKTETGNVIRSVPTRLLSKTYKKGSTSDNLIDIVHFK